ncbi:MAG: arginase family protein [Salinivirgaceae bacterium]|nr:arginase family protein [Salinivirgaceae bacterium]
MILNSDIAQYLDTRRPDNLKQFSSLEGFLGCQLYSEIDLQKSVDVQVAIIGIDETRNAYPMPYAAKADNVRYWLYQLAAFSNLKIADFGNLILGNNVADTYSAVSYLTESLVKSGIIPIYIGGSHDLTLPIVEGLLSVQNQVEIGIMDSSFDILKSESVNSRSFVGAMAQKYKSRLTTNIIGYQSYLVSSAQQDYLNDINIDGYRIGLLRQNINEMEPVLRDCDMISFDAGCVRQTDMPASQLLSPNGLYTEEACQLATFAGLSDKSEVFGTFGLVSKNTPLEVSANLTAQIIWHYIYGVSQRKNDYPKCNLDGYKKIFVKLNNTEFDLVFYQNLENERFWIEIPDVKGKEKTIISCSKSDYTQLVNNKISDRINRILRRHCL